MKIKSSSLLLALLAAMILSSICPALAGPYCGSNWMGDTSGDPDFYVSRNQNQGGMDSEGSASAPKTPALALGSAARANSNATISSVNVDLASPQGPGSAIIWMVEASNPGNEPMLYDFLLSGPSTGEEFRDMTGWTDQSTWTWNTTGADVGDNQIRVLVTRQGSAAFEDSQTLAYNIGNSSIASSENADMPRTAPDEAAKPQMDIIGANMRMPDTKPIPIAQPGDEATIAEAAPQNDEPEEPEVMDVEGKWTVRLENAGVSLNPLNLIQTGESIMGSGTFNEGGSKLQVSATGSVSSDGMSLRIWTVIAEYGNKIDKSVMLDLVEVDQTVSGSYELYSGEDLVGRGNATASRVVA